MEVMSERKEGVRSNHEREDTKPDRRVDMVGRGVLKITEIPPEDPKEVRKRDGIKPDAVGGRFMVNGGNGARRAPKFIGGSNPHS